MKSSAIPFPRISLLALFLVIVYTIGGCSSEGTVFDLSPQQSMLITGKGPGQDAAINPYKDGNSKAVVKNLGKVPVLVRIQQRGEIIDMTEIRGGSKKEFVLEKDYELYLDSEYGEGKAKVMFRKYD